MCGGSPQQKEPPRLTPRQAIRAVEILDHMLEFFGSGETWLQGEETDGKGNYCVLGAVTLCSPDPLSDSRVRLLLVHALNSQKSTVWAFNDRAKSYKSIKALILRARSMAVDRARADRRLRQPPRDPQRTSPLIRCRFPHRSTISG